MYRSGGEDDAGMLGCWDAGIVDASGQGELRAASGDAGDFGSSYFGRFQVLLEGLGFGICEVRARSGDTCAGQSNDWH